jgi:hypothetical protein
MWMFFMSALLGVLVNYTSFLVVQTTNSVMLKILNTVRTAGLVMFQVLFAGESLTKQQFFGCVQQREPFYISKVNSVCHHFDRHYERTRQKRLTG